MLESLKALKAAINVAGFPDDGTTEQAAKSLIDKLNVELEAEQYEEGVEVVAGTESLNMALDEVAASADDDLDENEDEDEDEEALSN